MRDDGLCWDGRAASPDYNNGILFENDRLAPLHRALVECVMAAAALINHYGERKQEVETHRLRTIHLSSEKMLRVSEALASLDEAIKESGK